jgi:alkaline phosphatase D
MSPISRRFLLVAGAAAGTLLTASVGQARPARLVLAAPTPLRIAPGHRGAQTLLLATRLTREASSGDGRVAEPVPVHWEVAADEQLRSVVRRGIVVACPDSGRDVHVRVRGLESGRRYWYRFRAQPEVSSTDPALALRRLRFTFILCEDSASGYSVYEGGPRLAPPRGDNRIEIVSHFRTLGTTERSS